MSKSSRLLLVFLRKANKKRQSDLVPYSLRHYHITREVKSGNNFGELSKQCGTSIRHIESTYLHVDRQTMKQ